MKNFRDSSIWGNKIGKQWSVASHISSTLYYINVVNQLLSEYLQINYIMPYIVAISRYYQRLRITRWYRRHFTVEATR